MVFNSSVSEFAMFALLCCMISTIVPIQLNGVWTDLAVISSLAGGIILLAWLVWRGLCFLFVCFLGLSLTKMIIAEVENIVSACKDNT